MDTLWRWRERLRWLFLRSRVEREVLDEMQAHIEMEADDLERRGVQPSQVQRQARLGFGNIERYREETREARFGYQVETAIGDVIYSLRLLRRNPAFAATAIATLSIGIAATTAIFSLVSSALLHPLPYERQSEVVWIHTEWRDVPVGAISPAEYLDYRSQLTDVFRSLGVYSYGTVNLTGSGEPERVRSAFVSSGVLPALGVEPLRGRLLTEREDEQGESVAMLSEQLWDRAFGRRDDIIGRQMLLNGQSFQIIAVLPQHLRLPEEVWLDASSELFLPQAIDPSTVTDRGSHYLSGVARLADGVGATQSARALEALTSRFQQDHPDSYPPDMQFQATAIPITDSVRGPLRAPMLALLAGVALLLLIVCVNVASLILARSHLRAREMALRSTLGAARTRMIRQVITESLVLGAGGGLFGLSLAALALAAARRSFPAGFDWSSMLRLDVMVALFGSSIAMLTGIAFGLVPALSLRRGRLAGALHPGSRSSTESPAQSRWRSLLGRRSAGAHARPPGHRRAHGQELHPAPRRRSWLPNDRARLRSRQPAGSRLPRRLGSDRLLPFADGGAHSERRRQRGRRRHQSTARHPARRHELRHRRQADPARPARPCSRLAGG